MAQLPILIIGGGLAGLSLAQGLKQASIPFHVFERDSSISARAQGYRIRISAEGAAALQSLLPQSLFKKFEDTCGEIVHGGHQVNAITVEPAEWQTRAPRHTGKAYNADRATLRRVLLDGLDDSITFGKKFERYELEQEGVTVWFSDGTSIEGRMIIGADGVRSAVRKQMLPDMVVLDTEGRSVFGKTILTPDIVPQIPNEVGKGNLIIRDPQATASPMRLFIDVMKFNHSYEGDIQLPADYIYWVLVFRQDRAGMPTRDLLSLSHSQSAETAVDLTKDWHSTCRAIVSNQDPSSSSTLAFMMTDPSINAWQASEHITVLGDAAHPMPPVGGIGANAAFEDSAALCKALSSGGTADLIGQYEESMRTRVKTALERSGSGAGAFFGMKPLEQLKPESIWD